jgi:hypothetical protein
MTDPAVVFHAAQLAALKASAELAALFPGGLVRAFAIPPENAALPWIKVGDDQIVEDSDECSSGSEIFAAVHIWTKPEPPDVALGRQMAGLVREILVDLELAGFDLVLGEFVEARHLTDPDGSSHAVLGFRYLATANPDPEIP